MLKLTGDAKAEYMSNLVGIIGWKIIMYVFQLCEIRESTISNQLDDSKIIQSSIFFILYLEKANHKSPPHTW